MNGQQPRRWSMLSSSESGILSENQERFFSMLVGMAKWALAQPPKSRFQYISPDQVKVHTRLNNALMNWWWAEHPVMTDAQLELFGDSLSHGLCPAAVVEHTRAQGMEWVLPNIFAPFRTEYELGLACGRLFGEWIDSMQRELTLLMERYHAGETLEASL